MDLEIFWYKYLLLSPAYSFIEILFSLMCEMLEMRISESYGTFSLKPLRRLVVVWCVVHRCSTSHLSYCNHRCLLCKISQSSKFSISKISLGRLVGSMVIMLSECSRGVHQCKRYFHKTLFHKIPSLRLIMRCLEYFFRMLSIFPDSSTKRK